MTQRQRQFLDAIERLSQGGQAPTYSQIASEMGWSPKTKGAVATMVRQLVDRGHLKHRPGRAATLEIVRERSTDFSSWATEDLTRTRDLMTAELVRRAVS